MNKYTDTHTNTHIHIHKCTHTHTSTRARARFNTFRFVFKTEEKVEQTDGQMDQWPDGKIDGCTD